MKLIRFRNFWPGSELSQENFFLPLLERVFEEKVSITQDPTRLVDLELSSVFSPLLSKSQRIVQRGKKEFQKLYSQNQVIQNPLNSRIETNARRRIWFTGENLRPPLADEFDLYLGFEPDGYHHSSVYLPLWVLNIDWFGKPKMHGFSGHSPRQEELLNHSTISMKDIQRKNGVCAFIGNMEETRRSALFNISQSLDTQIFGSVTGNLAKDKITSSRPFRFILSFENSIYPGYVTEKLLEASLTDAFPLYSGPPTVDYFNPSRFINLSNFENLEAFNAEILRLNSSIEELVFRLSQPVMLKPFDLENVILRIKEFILER